MDYQTFKELAAHRYRDEAGIAKHIKADKVIYLSLKGLKSVVKETYNCGICSGCFGGEYPLKIKGNHSKK